MLGRRADVGGRRAGLGPPRGCGLHARVTPGLDTPELVCGEHHVRPSRSPWHTPVVEQPCLLQGGRGPSVLLAPPHASPGPVPQDVLVCRSHLSQLGAASPCGFQDPSIHPASHSAPAGSRLGAAPGHTPAPPPLPRGLLPPPGRGQPRGHQPAGEDRRGRHCPEHDWDLWPSGRHAPLLPQTDRCSSPHYPPSAPFQ